MKFLFAKISFVILVMVLACTTINAQSNNQNQNTDASSSSPNRTGYDPFSNRSPIDDMHAKIRLKEQERVFKETLARAEEAEKITSELFKTFDTKKSLTATDRKKFDRLEKLVKGIRKSSGGDGDDEKPVQKSALMNDVLKELSDEASKLNLEIKKTSRVVVSVIVVEKTNLILDLIQIARTLPG